MALDVAQEIPVDPGAAGVGEARRESFEQRLALLLSVRVDNESDVGQLAVGYGVDLFVQLLACRHTPHSSVRDARLTTGRINRKIVGRRTVSGSDAVAVTGPPGSPIGLGLFSQPQTVYGPVEGNS